MKHKIATKDAAQPPPPAVPAVAAVVATPAPPVATPLAAPWFHGLVPEMTDDVDGLVEKQGDWLVRTTLVEGRMVHVIVIRWNHKVIIREKKGVFMIYAKKKRDTFATIEELINFYKNGAPLPGYEYRMLSAVVQQGWELRHEWITLGKKLGAGAFGEVFKGTIVRDGVTVDCAVKRSIAGSVLNKVQVEEMIAEARIMRNLVHANVVKCIGIAADSQPVMIVLELVSGGGLDEYLKENTTSTTMKIKFCLDASTGLLYLHDQHILHRDLACRNCLIGVDLVVMISDLGMAKKGPVYICEKGTTIKAPKKWLAPEVLNKGPFTKQSDIFSFGITVWEITHSAETPYKTLTISEAVKFVMEKGRMGIDNDPYIVPGLRPILRKSWEQNPEDRQNARKMKASLESLLGSMIVDD